jgi:RNA-directed DNA polymerase
VFFLIFYTHRTTRYTQFLPYSALVKSSGGGGTITGMNFFDHNYNNIISVENLLHAWREFRRGKKQKRDVMEFERNLMEHILNVHYDLKYRKYRHSGYDAFKITDPKPRDIHKASVRDRIVHHLIYNSLYSYFDERFIHDSYSCRIAKGTHKALQRFKQFSGKVSKNNTKTCWILKCDIRKFFANIDHITLKRILSEYIKDKQLLELLDRVIDSFSTEGKNDVGLPLGNLTSQLLVNVYMNEFDHFMKRILKVKYYIRYADDFIILHEDKNYLENLVPQISDFLEIELKLSLHPIKLFIKTLSSGLDFLGWVHFPNHRTLRTATKRRMLGNPGIYAGDEAVVNSYRGLLSHGNGWKLTQRINNIYVKVI